jgi:methylenetetrahydrofolate dehydrogenase (NADP+)/methenyltetrahydrofolate cyclohydrolase
MTALLIDGKAAAQALRERVARAASELRQERGVTPGLAVVLVGDDPASQVYVRNKARQTLDAGMASFEHRLPADVPATTLMQLVAELNADPAVHGILVQLPLPSQIDAEAVLRAIDPAKDVDGFHPINVGLLAVGQPRFVPCTPLGCSLLLKAQRPDLAGLHAVVIGRSNIVGKPMAQLLLAEHCTVTIAHSKTRDLPAVVCQADIVIAAVGRPGMVRGNWLRPGAIVIDVGINRIAADTASGNRLVGDVNFDEALQVAAAITPVPGGVGPMTIACLLLNTLRAAAWATQWALPEAVR